MTYPKVEPLRYMRDGEWEEIYYKDGTPVTVTITMDEHELTMRMKEIGRRIRRRKLIMRVLCDVLVCLSGIVFGFALRGLIG